jgi:hypothetical protein
MTSTQYATPNMTLDTPQQISAYRLLMLASALKLETKGIYPIKGCSAYAQIKKEFGLRGNKQKVLDQFNEMLVEAGIKQA